MTPSGAPRCTPSCRRSRASRARSRIWSISRGPPPRSASRWTSTGSSPRRCGSSPTTSASAASGLNRCSRPICAARSPTTTKFSRCCSICSSTPPMRRPAEGAVIKVITENQRAGQGADKSRRVVIKVIDNGIGIPREHLERVFDPFFTTKPAGAGVGLGLSLCQRMILSNRRHHSRRQRGRPRHRVTITLAARRGCRTRGTGRGHGRVLSSRNAMTQQRRFMDRAGTRTLSPAGRRRRAVDALDHRAARCAARATR